MHLMPNELVLELCVRRWKYSLLKPKVAELSTTPVSYIFTKDCEYDFDNDSRQSDTLQLVNTAVWFHGPQQNINKSGVNISGQSLCWD